MAKQKIAEGEYNPADPNAHLDLSAFDYKNWTPERWAEYQAILQTLEKRKNYDWEEYNAVGIFKKILNEKTDEMEETNILIGVQLLKDAPLKTTRVEAQHIEDWRMDRNKRWKMYSGLNAQIFDKGNLRTNSRFYLLKQPKEVKNA